ncbi:GntR family transcriptional regulator [Listeria booriae]|uniref:GntR family transcriptional regulator n=1 Tax=Listeria booriae TaxID=1552123 RepID=A0A842CRG6_9LIST|nr:GntR family transcriptional regulator [Listeria booriae]MBC2003656.1 GntR family transcriptional regulator [Listeria booriae]
MMIPNKIDKDDHRVADEIYAIMKSDVLNGKYKIGQVIKVQSVAALFGVSGNIAEQALQLVCQRGLLTPVAEDAFVVKKTHSQEFYYSGRFQVIFLNMEYIIQKLKSESIMIAREPLIAYVEAMRSNITQCHYAGYVAGCEGFYCELCNQAKMSILGETLRKMNHQLNELDDGFGKEFIWSSAAPTLESVELLLTALEERNYDQAKEIVQQLHKHYISRLTD